MGTTCVESGSVVLHDDSCDWVLEGFIKFAESSDDEVNEIVDVGVGFFFVIDGFDIFFCLFFAYAEEVVDCVIHDLNDFFGDELFLH